MVEQVFQVVSVTDFVPKMSGMVNVQRHPTIPMRKRDSLGISGSRISLLSAGSNTNSTTSEDKRQASTHSDIAGGKRKSPKKIKRTDSYKRALNRLSQYDNVDGEIMVTVTAEVARRRADEKQKYNTLPINTAQATCNGESHRKKRHSGDDKNGGIVQRNASQKSGTYPSPDTDEDQRAVQPDRKKKSAFKRFKERFMSSVRRDRESQAARKNKKKPGTVTQSSSKRGRVLPDFFPQSAAGFHTPNGFSANAHPSQNEHINKTVDNGAHTMTRGTFERQESAKEHSSGKKKGSGILTAIRQSFRRKQPPAKLRTQKKSSSDDRPSSNEIHSSANSTCPPAVTQKPSSVPVEIPALLDTPGSRAGDETIEGEDSITAIFGSIIDPPRSATASARGPDRSKLRLEGLRKCRPRSFDKEDGAHGVAGFLSCELSPTVEIDGLDFADGPIHSGQSTGPQSEEELAFHELLPDEQQRRIDDVAQRLAALGDKIAAEKQRESSGSSSEIDGHRVGLTNLERTLLRDLHHYADKEFGKNGTNVSINLMPAITSILAAQDYSKFKQVVQQEISNTTGWEQVAWYTCIIKATVCIAETSVGAVVKTRAKKFFNSVFRPWIESRPNGWESIHEETDVESELD